MKVNFDRMRTNATSDMNALFHIIEDIIENDNIYDSEKEELIDKFNEAAINGKPNEKKKTRSQTSQLILWETR
jgi:hypothetical protein